MTGQQKADAMSLILGSNNVKASFNVPINGSYNTIHQIVIHECNATLINQLIHAGFFLYQKEGLGLLVEHL